MRAPLDGAYLRVNWAEKRLLHLRRDITDYANREIDANDIDAEFQAGGQLVLTLSPMDEPPLNLAILLGEVVDHLRSALDYLVFELARNDSGKIQHGTQFPIERTPKGFAQRRSKYLIGVSPEHVDAIKLLQPCTGCGWTGDLAAISDPDKHRTLHATLAVQEGSYSIAIGDARQIGEAPGNWKPLRNDPASRQVKVHFELEAFSVTFGDGEPEVLHVLELLKSRVSQTLDVFKPCLEGQCRH